MKQQPLSMAYMPVGHLRGSADVALAGLRLTGSLRGPWISLACDGASPSILSKSPQVPKQWPSNLGAHQNRRGLMKTWVVGPTPRVADSEALGWVLRFCTFYKFLGDSEAAGLGFSLWEALSRKTSYEVMMKGDPYQT